MLMNHDLDWTFYGINGEIPYCIVVMYMYVINGSNDYLGLMGISSAMEGIVKIYFLSAHN